MNDGEYRTTDYPGLRREIGIRIRLRQDTLNLALAIQTAILVIAVIFHSMMVPDRQSGGLLLIIPFIGFIFEFMLLDHQIKGMIATLYLKLPGRSMWLSFYDSFTYEHRVMR